MVNRRLRGPRCEHRDPKNTRGVGRALAGATIIVPGPTGLNDHNPEHVRGICQRGHSRAPIQSLTRHVRLFRNNRNQATRIPVEFELPGSETIISRDGDRLIITPVRRKGLAALLGSWVPSDEKFPEIDDPAPKDIF